MQSGGMTMSSQKQQPQRDSVLIVAKDEELRESLADALENAGGYLVTQAGSFEDALSEILLHGFSLVLTEAELPDLSGIDLLAVVNSLTPNVPVMVIDDDLSAKSAMAAFRLGAVDYFSKPINLEFILMQVQQRLDLPRKAQVAEEAPAPARPPRDRERYLDPRTRAAALMLRRDQFEKINVELNRLRAQVKANFVGLVDADGNMVGATGSLENADLILLKQALTIDHDATKSLASILDEHHFASSYFEGENSGVYIVEFGHPLLVSLVVICASSVKPGMVWLYGKRTAAAIGDILKTIEGKRASTIVPVITPATPGDGI
jgi:DNA-binding response OmpR family regulator